MLSNECRVDEWPPLRCLRGIATALLTIAVLGSSVASAFAEIDAPSPAKDEIASLPTATDDGAPAAMDAARSTALRLGDTRSNFHVLIEKEAKREGLAPEIAEAVMAVESGYNPAAIGGVGEIGLMQIRPATARMLGFAGTDADLAAPATNIRYGVTYLAQAYRLAGGDLCTAVMKYRAGHGESRFSYLSVNYCLAVRSKLLARGFRVTGNVPVATFGEPGVGGCKRKCLEGGRIGTVNLVALNTKLNTLVMQVRATR
jgi:soluble lytic murein transglycosylase-like protein